MRILITQMTRMGDVLQTTPLIRAVRLKYPDAHIAVMVRKMGKAVAERNPDINEVVIYDEDEMFANVRAQDSDRLLKAYENAESYIALLKGRYDLVYNCTHSVSSAMLMKLAELPKVIGAHLSDDWQFVLRGRWVNYFFTSVFHREYNDLNLCDITRHFEPSAPPRGELVFELTSEDRAFAETLFSSVMLNEVKHLAQEQSEILRSAQNDMGGRAQNEAEAQNDRNQLVCFQLGASENHKRWAETHFAGLAQLLHERQQARIALVGVKEEAPLGDVFMKHAPGIATPLYGKTSIPQLAALLERSALLVTNDTGTMHIAAAVKCPVLLVSVGNVHFRETGPYGAGHFAIERRRERVGRADFVPSEVDERTFIQPEQVCRVIDMMRLLCNGSVPPEPDTILRAQIVEPPELAGVDIFCSAYAPDGCLEWYPLIRRPLEERDFLRIAYRAMWLEHLDAISNKRQAKESMTAMLRCYDVSNEAVQTWRDAFGNVFRQLADLARCGVETTERLVEHIKKGKSMRAASSLVTQLTALDEDMRIFGELNNSCKPLVVIARFERDNLEGAEPLRLAETTLQIYRDCFSRARLMERTIHEITCS